MPNTTKSNNNDAINSGRYFGARRFISTHMYLLLFIPLLVIAYPLAKPGIIIDQDFPSLDTSDYSSGKLWTWTEKGSVPALETISRFPIIGLWYIMGFIHIGSDLISKLIILSGFLLSSLSFYFSFLL